MSIERRTEPRETLSLPVSMGSCQAGVIRDLSASGLFMETDFGSEMGDLLDLEFTLGSSNVHFKFLAQASVLRTECRDQRCGMAVKLISTRMEVIRAKPLND